MKLPTYEEQNAWIRTYLVPLCDLNFAKAARNYRLRQSKPFSDERMAQIREDVLAESREELDNAQKDGNPIYEYRYDNTSRHGMDRIRSVRRDAYGGGLLRLAPLEIDYVTNDPVLCLEKKIVGLLAASKKPVSEMMVPNTSDMIKNFVDSNSYNGFIQGLLQKRCKSDVRIFFNH